MINDFKNSIITKKNYEDILKVDDYYEGRWEYYTEIINQLKTLEDIHSVLEFGPYKLPFVKGSDIIDVVDDYKDDFPFEIGKFIVHDCSQLPLPIEDNKYDLVLACQVIEHLGLYGEQIELFKELERISKKVIIISLPYLWHRPVRRDHHMIDRKMILRWTGGKVPSYEKISGQRNSRRILQIYDPNAEAVGDEEYMKKVKNQDDKIFLKDTYFYKKHLKEIRQLKKSKEDLSKKYDSLNEEKQSLELENEKLLKEINILKNTASWKVTKPLRDVKNKLR